MGRERDRWEERNWIERKESRDSVLLRNGYERERWMERERITEKMKHSEMFAVVTFSVNMSV